EPASPVRDDSQGEAYPTDSGFIADQDRATIAKSSTLPRDSAPRVISPAAEEGSMQQTINELTAFCTSLQRQHSELLAKFQSQEVEIIRLKERVKILEDKEGVIGDKSRDDAPIKGRSTNEGEAAVERISNDSEEIARFLTSMDAATVLAWETNVPTGSGFIPTAGPPATVISTGSEVGPTASLIVRRRKGKEVMVESNTLKKKRLQEQVDAQVARELEEQQEREDMRMNEQIARDAEVARIHAEEEIQGMIDSLDKTNETVAKYLQEYQQFALELPLKKKIELISDLVKYQDHYTKEEAERLKRKGINLEKGQVKKQKSSEEAPETETSTEEITEDKIKEIMQLVPVEDVYVQALQSQQKRPMSKKQKREYYMAVIKSNLGWRFKDFKGMTFKEIEAKFVQVWKQVEDFIPMGSKEEAERVKRTGINLEKGQVKKQKSSEEAPETETSTEEFTKDKIKEIMQLVPVKDVYVQALQVKHPIID
nr:hypothetical protein [Tanacetum cinerariifolium]